MSLVINNNLMAMNATRNLNDSYGKLATSTRRLSSGLRVGTAADDAAGLAMRELMRADIKTLGQGLRNANDGISMIQTADGGLGVIDAKLIRMKELAEQAATGTYTDVQRKMINQEYQLMAKEITRIAQDTDFNSRKLLAGSGQDIEVENSVASSAGAKDAVKVNEDGNTETWTSIGPTSETVTKTAGTTTLGTTDATGIQTFNATAVDVISYKSRSGKAVIANDIAVSSGSIDTKTGELTSATALDAAGSTITTGQYAGTKVTIEQFDGTQWVDITATVDAGAYVAANNDIRISSENTDGSVIRDTFSNNTAGTFSLTQNTAGTDYTIGTGTLSTTAIQVKSEVAASKTFTQTTKTGVTVVNDATSFFEDNSTSVIPNKASFTHDGKTGEINKAKAVQSSATSSYGSIKTPVQEYTIEAYNETTNTWEKLSLNATVGSTLDISSSVKEFRITAEYSDNQMVRDTFSNNTDGAFTITKTQYGMDLGMTTGAGAQDSSTQLNVKSEDLVVVNVHFGSGSQETDSYNTYINMATAKSLGVGDVAGDNIETQDNAKKALDNLTIAITRKDEIRAEIGSTQNRLAATIENVSIQKENLQASESRISDVDVATEMTEFNKTQIMTNAAVSMLAQANSLPKMAQKLLDAR
ncbi:Flagellin [Halodesulfovibrio sp. MK-HDV]|jgi:flagellin|nr:Flagellin [Halodesulfovibrio sp. MK-HDV]